MILSRLSLHTQKCLYCEGYAVSRVGIDVDLRENGDIKSGFIYLCQKHIKYLDVIGNMKICTCFTSCLREMR